LTLLREESERLSVSVDALVIAAALAEPFADTVLSGATTTKQLLSNLIGSRIVLDADARSRLVEIVESPNEYWAKRRTLPWN
jgi:aryl-alcohol dehydrogenase-like predicted oxidoreductase